MGKVELYGAGLRVSHAGLTVRDLQHGLRIGSRWLSYEICIDSKELLTTGMRSLEGVEGIWQGLNIK